MLLALFAINSVIEPMGIAQIVALLPLYLAKVGVPASEVPQWVGLFTPLIFLFGLPFIPLWGVWADKYSRKAVIVRSAAVEAIVLAGVAASQAPWQLAASLMLIGLSLGNTGVMLAVLRETVPPARLGTSFAIVGAAGPIGFALGPGLAALLVEGLGRSLSDVFVVSSALMFVVTAMVAIWMPEVRPERVPSAPALRLAYGALRGTLADAPTRALFLLFGVALLAGQMTSTYLPVLVQRIHGGGDGLVGAIGIVGGGAALVGALATPVAGAIGDRIGFRPVLCLGLAGAGVALLTLPGSASVAQLAAATTVYALCIGAARAMILALLAVEVPADRRSATLNLVYLPLYLAGIAGPALGAVLVAGGGVGLVYSAAGLILGATGIAVAYGLRAARATAPA